MFFLNEILIVLGATRNVTLTLPAGFPVGAGELTIVGTGGVSFEEKRDIIVYDSRYVVLVQTSASTYRPGDSLEVRVVVTNEELIPVETAEVLIQIYVCLYFSSFVIVDIIFSKSRMLILNSLVNFHMFQSILVKDFS